MCALSRFLLLLILIACCAEAYASGAQFPLASYAYTFGTGGLVTFAPGSYTGMSCGGLAGSCETDSASATASLVLQTSGNSGPLWSAAPSVSVGVYYVLVGPANTQAQVTITGFGSISFNAHSGYAFSAIDGGIGNPALICTEIGNTTCEGISGSYSPNSGPLVQTVPVLSNRVYEFTVEAACEAEDGTCSAFLDPSVVVTSGNASSFVVELSPNVTLVPEPATLALVFAGLGLSRHALRRKGTKRNS